MGDLIVKGLANLNQGTVIDGKNNAQKVVMNYLEMLKNNYTASPGFSTQASQESNLLQSLGNLAYSDSDVVEPKERYLLDYRMVSIIFILYFLKKNKEVLPAGFSETVYKENLQKIVIQTASGITEEMNKRAGNTIQKKRKSDLISSSGERYVQAQLDHATEFVKKLCCETGWHERPQYGLDIPTKCPQPSRFHSPIWTLECPENHFPVYCGIDEDSYREILVELLKKNSSQSVGDDQMADAEAVTTPPP